MKEILTDDKAEVVEKFFEEMQENGQWAGLEKVIAATQQPLVVAWKMGFFHALLAREIKAIQVVAVKRGDQN